MMSEGAVKVVCLQIDLDSREHGPALDTTPRQHIEDMIKALFDVNADDGTEMVAYFPSEFDESADPLTVRLSLDDDNIVLDIDLRKALEAGEEPGPERIAAALRELADRITRGQVG